MQYSTSKSKCNLCNKEFTARGIGRHISACLKKHSPVGKDFISKKYYYIIVQAAYNNDYSCTCCWLKNAVLNN